MTNLLQETIQAIEKSGHTIDDIIFIGSLTSGHSCTWDEFKTLADIEYDAGYGAQEVASDLVICFGDGNRLWRREYDGSEKWDFFVQKLIPKREDRKPISRLTVNGTRFIGWVELNELNGIDANDD